MSIFISENNNDGKWINDSPFEKEEELQKYISDNPNSIPLQEYKENTKLLIICREFPTIHGESIDHIGIDDDGEIYIIETKKWKNPDKRQVVSQVIDYGATLTSNDSTFDDFLTNTKNWISNTYNQTFEEKIKNQFKIDENEINDLISKIKNNYDSNKFTFVIVMDRTDSRIKNYVKYLNQYHNFTILLVEYLRYVYGDIHIIQPKLCSDKIKKNGIRYNWKKKDFEEQISNSKFDPKTKQAIENLMEFTKEMMPSEWEGTWHQFFGGTGKSPMFFGYLSKIHENQSLYEINSITGELIIKFWSLNAKPKLLERFLDECSKNNFEDIVDTYYKRPRSSSSVSDWANRVDEFTRILKEVFS